MAAGLNSVVGGVAEESANPEVTKEQTTEQAEPQFLADQKARNRGEAKSCNATVGGISSRGAETGNQADLLAFCQGATDAKHSNWSNRRRDGDSNDKAFEHEIKRHE